MTAPSHTQKLTNYVACIKYNKIKPVGMVAVAVPAVVVVYIPPSFEIPKGEKEIGRGWWSLF
jgi:hypothetical protein